MIAILADALVPIFAGLLLGYIAGLRGVLDNQKTGPLSYSQGGCFCTEVRLRQQHAVGVFLKNVLQPGLALAIAMLLDLSLPQTRYVTVHRGHTVWIFRNRLRRGFDSSPKLASSGLIASYPIGVATLAVWIVILNHIG